MKNRNGFTLVEVLAVIVILGLLISIGMGTYSNVANRQRVKAYENKVAYIEMAAEKWASEVNLSKSTTITVSKLIESSYLQADKYDSNNGYILEDPRDSKSLICNTITITLENGDPTAKFNEVENCDLRDIESSSEKIRVAAFSYDKKTKQITSVLKNKNEATRTLRWVNQDVLLVVEPDSDYANYSKVVFSNNGKTNTNNVVNNNIKSVGNIKVGDVINYSSFANMMLVETNIYVNTEYVVGVYADKGLVNSNPITVKIDKEAPIIKVSKTNEYTNKKRTIYLEGNDKAGSGFKGFYISKTENDFSSSNFKSSNNKVEYQVSNGIYYIYGEDNAGNKSVVSKVEIVNVDEKEPECEIRVEGTKGADDWYKSNVKFTHIYSDSDSGIAYHNISTTLLTDNTSSFTVNAEVKDNAGNTKKCSVTVKKDSKIPETPTIAVSDGVSSGNWHKVNPTLTLSGSSSTSGITYSWTSSGGTPVSNNSGTTLVQNVNTTGTTYTIKACNGAGACSSTVTYVMKVDTVTPSVPTITASDNIASNTWHTADFNLTGSGCNNISGNTYYYGTNNNPTSTTKSTINSNTTTSGTTYYVKVCSGSGLCSGTSSYIAKLDKTTPSAPSITASDSKASGSWHTANFTLTGGGCSNVSGCTYKYGTSTNPTSTTKSTISSDTNGTTYYVKVCSGAGKCSGNSSYNAKLDKTQPAITFGTNGNGTALVTQSSKITVTDGGSGVSSIKYLWSTTNNSNASGGTSINNGGTATVSDKTGTYYLCVYATDSAGNSNNVCSNGFAMKRACEYSVNKTWTLSYTGKVESFTVPCKGTYKIEAWGAQGGNVNNLSSERLASGGYGGYAQGSKSFDKNTVIYYAIGGQGTSSSCGFKSGEYTSKDAPGGWNGGGLGRERTLPYHTDMCGAGGGGATHVASTNRGVLTNYASYKSELYLVAGAGGGAAARFGYTAPDGWEAQIYVYKEKGYPGGRGGGTSGETVSGSSGYGGSQSASTSNGTSNAGGFGFGGTGQYGYPSGGGAGLYGGASSNWNYNSSNVADFEEDGHFSSSGGSGYVGITGGSTAYSTQEGNGKIVITLVSID